MSSFEKSSDISSNSMSRSAKVKKLILRIYIWDIYKKVYLAEDAEERASHEKIQSCREMLAELFAGQDYIVKKVDLIFPSTGVENWENLCLNLKVFENNVTIPGLLTLSANDRPLEGKIINVLTSEDISYTTKIEILSDPLTEASELILEHSLPSEELDYLQGMIQHEMIEVVRDAVETQKDKIKQIQYNMSVVEHLTLLAENVCVKYRKLQNILEPTASKQPKARDYQVGSSLSSSTPFESRTIKTFNNHIIDERRKLEAVNKKIREILQSIGPLTPSEEFDAGRSDAQDETSSLAPFAPPPSPSRGPSSSSSSPRRASVSFRAAMESAKSIQSIQPFGGGAEKALHALDENEEDGEDGGQRGGGFGWAKQSMEQGEDWCDGEDWSEGKSAASEKKSMFKKSECDRLRLFTENKKLREELSSATSRDQQLDSASSVELYTVMNDLNSWEGERDDLDGQIDRLLDLRDSLRDKLKAKGRKVDEGDDDEEAEQQESAN